MTESALYLGRLTHVRHAPRRHAFSYRLYQLYLDLEELPGLPTTPLFGVEKPRPLSFRRRDYLGRPDQPLREAVLDEVAHTLGSRPRGPVRLLTHVRTCGYVFNPVSFYYCFEPDGRTLEAVVAEITNTPWGERHRYVVPAGASGAGGRFAKAFHVSPFLPMAQTYDWRFTVPGARLGVAMANEQDGQIVFRAQLALVRRPLSAGLLALVALGQPLVSARLHAGIYAQALQLWLKGTPFFPHPGAADRGSSP
jgi:uncharacterized protein